jgi:hypothetical protein
MMILLVAEVVVVGQSIMVEGGKGVVAVMAAVIVAMAMCRVLSCKAFFGEGGMV